MAEKASKALVQAAEIGSLQGVKAALEAGADIDHVQEVNNITGTALFIASHRGYVDILKLLLCKGASVTKRGEGAVAAAPLHVAALRGHTEVVDLLVHHGATLDIREAYQKTPLMIAGSWGQVDTVRQLIQLGARVDLTDFRGHTALMHCEMSPFVLDQEFAEMMALLQEAMETRLLRCCYPPCGKPGYRSTLKLCGRCKLTRYCSRDCQKQHWTVGHKKCCGHDAYTGETPDPFHEMTKYKFTLPGGLSSERILQHLFPEKFPQVREVVGPKNQ
ncbi:PREDICTED: ankyrin repeat and SOCS box protein 11-like [Branchiostoma belcheri]|uniref:Ankyrin repeat and SOCS box protein 11-like n=1 Tax=Branchiostoma belcheri TaxID=7741 RepID=A0A6P5A1R0_BRABE|nr:PREDICTED: ankyrin repeat and SOCS box protein 11-like [Branchiostoma belcheri]